MDHYIQLSEQYSGLAIDLGQMLQGVWQFDALVTFAAIGWALSVGQYKKPPSLFARFLVALGLSGFYALNVYVLWNLLERLRAAQSLAKHYAVLTNTGENTAAINAVYQEFPDYVLQGSAGIGAAVVVIVLILMSSSGRAAQWDGESNSSASGFAYPTTPKTRLRKPNARSSPPSGETA